MNQIFSPTGEGWPGYPARSFGWLDETVPLLVENAPEAVFSFDVVDANWGGFSSGTFLALSNVAAIEAKHVNAWEKLFAGKNSTERIYSSA